MNYSTKVRMIYEIYNIIIKNNLSYADAQNIFETASLEAQCIINYFGKNPDDIVIENPVDERMRNFHGINAEASTNG